MTSTQSSKTNLLLINVHFESNFFQFKCITLFQLQFLGEKKRNDFCFSLTISKLLNNMTNVFLFFARLGFSSLAIEHIFYRIHTHSILADTFLLFLFIRVRIYNLSYQSLEETFQIKTTTPSMDLYPSLSLSLSLSLCLCANFDEKTNHFI